MSGCRGDCSGLRCRGTSGSDGDTPHMWTQIVGHAAGATRCRTTGGMCHCMAAGAGNVGGDAVWDNVLDVEFDFVTHVLHLAGVGCG